MRLTLLVSLLLSALALADVTPQLRDAAALNQNLEWSNSRPEQRQALDNFYRSLEQQRLQDSLSQRELRMQRFEQLQRMTPEQRQQQMLDHMQQRQQIQQQMLMPNR